MRLSEIEGENFSDEEIQRIVYSEVEDSKRKTEYAVVFGNSMLIKERVNTAVESYKRGRVKKLIFTGGSGGVSNQKHDFVPEAIKMKNLAIDLGVREEDILVECQSNNSFENVDNSLKMLPGSCNCISIITSEFHLKRCMAIIKKKFPTMEVVLIASKDGFSDSDNWFLSDNSWNSGRNLATYEANLLIKYAKNNQIYDLELPTFKSQYSKQRMDMNENFRRNKERI